MENIPMVAVNSSNIESVGYDQDTETLYVEFKNGSAYKYDNVPFWKFTELVDADSAGKYLNAEIKGQHEYSRL